MNELTVGTWLQEKLDLLGDSFKNLFIFLALAMSENRTDVLEWHINNRIENGANRVEEINELLYFAVPGGHVEVIKWLKEIGADINSYNNEGYTPLQSAIHAQKIECIRCLVALGADMNKRSKKGDLPILSAIYSDSVDIINCLCEFGVSLDDSLIYSAAMAGKIESIKCLASLGVDIKTKNDNKNGGTPLHWAALAGQIESIKCLAELGADVKVKDNNGNSAIFYAVMNDQLDCIRYLYSIGFDINEENDAGQTPIFVAASAVEINLELFECLKSLGAITDKKSKNGKTPLDVATEFNLNEAVTWLKNNK